MKASLVAKVRKQEAGRVRWFVVSRDEDGSVDRFTVDLPINATARDIKIAADKSIGTHPDKEYRIRKATKTTKGWRIELAGYRGFKVKINAKHR